MQQPEHHEVRMPIRLPPVKVSPFPRERFVRFCQMLKIQTKDFGMVPMQFLGTQTYVLDEMCKALDEGKTTFFILKARQLGMTTFFIALDLFWAMEHPGLLGAFVTHTDQAKALFRNTIKIFFANLPKTHKIRWDNENRDMIVLRNGSLLQYLVAGIKEKTKGGLGRSSANNYAHGTEVAFWGAPDDLNELAATMSTHYPHRLYIEETTANGFNFWEERWREGKDDPTICTIFVGWWRHDHYQFPDDHPWFTIYMPQGQETSLHVLERKRVNAVEKRYGVRVTKNQIAWYRWHLETKLGNDQSKMDEMFPWLEEDAFVSTGSQFFANAALTDAMRRARDQPFMPFKYNMTDNWADTQVVATRDRRAELRVWEEANAQGHYVIGCDPAYGSSEFADRAVINVSRCFSDRLVQVAEFVSPTISTYQCAWVLCHLAGYYRNVMVNLEINGPGEAVFNEMNALKRETQHMVDHATDGKITYDLRYVLTMMRHFLYSRSDSMTMSLAYQWRTTGSNKPGILSALKDSFELKRNVINSMYLLEEMKTVKIDGGIIQAEEGKKDDRVMAAALAHEAWRKWVRPKLLALGLTFESAYRESIGQGPSQAERIAINYLKSQKIMLPGTPAQ
jgi:hypothetical protein